MLSIWWDPNCTVCSDLCRNRGADYASVLATSILRFERAGDACPDDRLRLKNILNEWGKVLVWKEIDYGQMSEREKEMLVSEVNILRGFSHPHIVR